MASVLMMIGGAVVNALAFTGGNALFSMMNKQGAEAEARRHNQALEKYQKDMEEYNIKNSEYRNWLLTQTQRQQQAQQDIADGNKSLEEYHEMEEPTPPIFDYTPSGEQKKYEHMFNLLGTGAMVTGAVKSFE